MIVDSIMRGWGFWTNLFREYVSERRHNDIRIEKSSDLIKFRVYGSMGGGLRKAPLMHQNPRARTPNGTRVMCGEGGWCCVGGVVRDVNNDDAVNGCLRMFTKTRWRWRHKFHVLSCRCVSPPPVLAGGSFVKAAVKHPRKIMMTCHMSNA